MWLYRSEQLLPNQVTFTWRHSQWDSGQCKWERLPFDHVIATYVFFPFCTRWPLWATFIRTLSSSFASHGEMALKQWIRFLSTFSTRTRPSHSALFNWNKVSVVYATKLSLSHLHLRFSDFYSVSESGTFVLLNQIFCHSTASGVFWQHFFAWKLVSGAQFVFSGSFSHRRPVSLCLSVTSGVTLFISSHCSLMLTSDLFAACLAKRAIYVHSHVWVTFFVFCFVLVALVEL